MTRELDERLRAAMARDDVGALVDVGCDLADVDRQADALVCFQRAVALGDELMWFNVANTLRELDRPLEAIDAYEKALAAGETDAWLNLGLVLESVGDLAGAMSAYRAAWDAGGQPEGYVNLALALRRQGLRAEAEATLKEAADREHAGAARRGRGHGGTRASLAQLLLATGRRQEARAQLELGAKLGQEGCWLPLGNLLWGDDLEEDDVDEAAAEEAYRAGIAAGDLHCHHNLAMLLLHVGDVAGAEAPAGGCHRGRRTGAASLAATPRRRLRRPAEDRSRSVRARQEVSVPASPICPLAGLGGEHTAVPVAVMMTLGALVSLHALLAIARPAAPTNRPGPASRGRSRTRARRPARGRAARAS